MDKLAEGSIVVILVLAIVYMVWVWNYATKETEDLEDELIAIRGKLQDYAVLRALRDEYTLYRMEMNGRKHTMTYEEWLESRIVLEGSGK